MRRWKREGFISPARTVSGQRYFTEADVLAALRPAFAEALRPVVMY